MGLRNIKYTSDIIRKFKELWPYYIIQSLAATVVFALLVFLLGEESKVTISSMAATCFIIFAMPATPSAKSQNVIGGHFLGLACGGIFFLTSMPYYIEYPLAVGLVIYLMVVLDFEHPPAVGTTIAVIINEVGFYDFITIISSAILLSVCHYYFRDKLRNLV